MLPKFIHIRSVNDYVRYVGAPVLHELVSVIHYDELTSMRHSLNRYAQVLRPVFDAAEAEGLSIWDTATVYAMGESERILGSFIAGKNREDYILSTKFTPQLAEMYDNSVE